MIAKTAAKTNPSTAAKAEGQAFTISRVIDAPLDRVWKAWTDAKQLKHWWGPKGFRDRLDQGRSQARRRLPLPS
jgi:uncharacterized protein YndB with AHSA1/START domain